MDREFANRGFTLLNKECEIGLLDTQYIAVLNADKLNLDELRNISNQIDDAYNELLDLYQEQLKEILVDVNIDDEERSIVATHTIQRLAEICSIMFE